MSFGFFCLEERFEEDLRCKTVMRVECLDGEFECKRADGGGGEEPILTATKPKHRRGKERMREKGH